MRPLTRSQRLRIRVLGWCLGLQQRLRWLNLWLAEPILHRDVEVPPAHRCIYDSRAGIVPGRAWYLACKCGRWAEVGLGDARPIPSGDVPLVCSVLSRMHFASRQLRNCCIALTVGILFALILFPGLVLQ